jgi:hypothetical protein
MRRAKHEPVKGQNTLLGDGNQVDGAVEAAAGAAGSWAQLPTRRADQLAGEVAGWAGIAEGVNCSVGDR